MEILKLTLAANQVSELAFRGNYFALRQSPSNLDIELLDRSGAVINLLRGALETDFISGRMYETIRVSNGPTAQTISLWAGEGSAGSNRTSGLVKIDGTSAVSVVDGEKIRTLAGGMYAGSIVSSPSGGNLAACQILNPTGTGKNLIISSVTVDSNAPQSAYFYSSNAVFSNVVTATNSANKLAGGALGAAHLRWDVFAGLPAFSSNLLRNFNLPAGIQITWNIAGALVLPPGRSFNLMGGTPNSQLVCNLEWFEELI
jgi:hypothetical protein